ncbi:hypothetical protein [Asticcacaulis solisilvae]|uniref:hypothetical protein n=1 Tax=Asticcacaulis solisilvae TaxID=1217274 RepID=UPI003FD7D9F8
MKRFLPVLLLCAACSKAPEKPAEASPPPAPVAVIAAPPADQAALIQAVVAVRAAPNDQAAYARFCDAFETLKGFDGWRATIADSQVSTVNGSVDITFDIGHVRLEQVVQKTDPVYPAIEALNGRQDVVISGTFPHRNGRDECAYYRGTFTVALTKVQ